jgi:hypothetical protein
MDQLKEEIINHKPKRKSKIQLSGDNNNIFNESKLITICVFNSVNLIENYASTFEKIFIDEAHHINKPNIYYENEEDNIEDSKDNSIKNEINNTDEDIIDDVLEYFIDDVLSNTEDIIDDIEDELINVKNYTYYSI